jgi:hypothetical protein
MTHDPKLQLVATLQTARTYHLRSSEPIGGWALCTVNDATGELLIVSDWGNWSHHWNPKHLGSPSLTHFITDRRGYDYLAGKLLGSRDARVLDAGRTIAKWRKQLCDRRLSEGREGMYGLYGDRPGAYRAREIWRSLGSLFDDEQNESIFIERACQIEGFTRWISSEPWKETEHCYSHEYRVLVDFLLPALAAACRATIERDQAITTVKECTS